MVFESAEALAFIIKNYRADTGAVQTLERLGELLDGLFAESPAAREQVFRISRVFDAPRALVYQAWTEPAMLQHWWGPKGFTFRTGRNDVQPGGMFHYALVSPEGREMWGRWVFRQVVAPELLSFVASFSDADGGVTRHPFAPEWPLEVLSIVHFSDVGDKTQIEMIGLPIHASEQERQIFRGGRDSMQHGWTGTLDELAAFLATQHSE
ncbi:MAG: SRPBCC domain-containing protein [Planctomycetes bacterium]|nr:SRPBCC domain-containing protein [Planctomycetota bacterium]